MAKEEKSTYPVIPEKHWWALRANFRRSIPSSVTAGYIAAALQMEEKSARTNILPSLISFKLIDTDGKPLERAKRWRDDEEYAKVCEEIREEIYPRELLDALPPPTPNRNSAERWFASKTGVGEVGARRMAVVYELLCEANPNGLSDSAKAPAQPTKAVKPKPPKTDKPAQKTSNDSTESDRLPTRQPLPSVSQVPAIHINIQVHISPEVTATQIDQIFASMAKHLGSMSR